MLSSSPKDSVRELQGHGEEKMPDATGALNDPEAGNKEVAPPVSPLLNGAKGSSGQVLLEKGRRPLSDAGPLEANPWDTFFKYSLIGLGLAIALPLVVQIAYDKFMAPEDKFMAPEAWSAKMDLPMEVDFLCGIGVTFCGTAILLFCGGQVVDRYLAEVFCGCCARRRWDVPGPKGRRVALSVNCFLKTCCSWCCKICGKLVFGCAFMYLVFAAWFGCSWWKALASSQYETCLVMCHLEVRSILRDRFVDDHFEKCLQTPSAFDSCNASELCYGEQTCVAYTYCQTRCITDASTERQSSVVRDYLQQGANESCRTTSTVTTSTSTKVTTTRSTTTVSEDEGQTKNEVPQQHYVYWPSPTRVVDRNESEYECRGRVKRDLLAFFRIDYSWQLRDYGSERHTKFLQLCMDNGMVDNKGAHVWFWDREEVSKRLNYVWPMRSLFMPNCAATLYKNSPFGKVMLRHGYNFTAFQSRWLQSKNIDAREIYGPPCGVAWLIIMAASRLALRRKLPSLNVSRNHFLRQKLVSKSTEYVWLFSHMYSMQGMRVEDIRRTWIIRNLKEAAPAWELKDVAIPEWLTVHIFNKENDQKKDAAEGDGGQAESSSAGTSSSGEFRRRPKAGDTVKVEYQAFWVRSEADCHLGDWLEVKEGWELANDGTEPLTFIVEEGEVIQAFHKGVQRMRFPAGLPGQQSRMCDTATFTIDLKTASNEKDKLIAPWMSNDDVGFDPRNYHERYAALVYKVKLFDGTPREEEDRDANGFVDSSERCCSSSVSPEFLPAARWSFFFALGFALVPALVSVYNVLMYFRGDSLEDRQQAVDVIKFNMWVIFVTSGLVFFGFVRAYFALQSKLETIKAFDCMWQFPEEDPLEVVEDYDGRPLLHDVEGWLQVLKAVDKQEEGEELSTNAQLTRDTEAWKDTMKNVLDNKGYRASFTRHTIEDYHFLKLNVDRLDEWFNMRRFLQLDAYDERSSLELATVVILLTLVPEVIVIVSDLMVLLVGDGMVENFLGAHVVSLWNLIFSLSFVFGYLRVSLKLNDAFERHVVQLESLKSHVKRRVGKKEDTDREVERIGDLMESTKASASWARFLGFQVNSSFVTAFLLSAGAWVLAEVWSICHALLEEASKKQFGLGDD